MVRRIDPRTLDDFPPQKLKSIVSKRFLKADAIRDIETIDTRAWMLRSGMPFTVFDSKIKYTKDEVEGIRKYLVWKHNLTEDDLK